MVEMPEIDQEKCDGCGLCVNVCYCKALVLVDNVLTVIATESCDWCTLCEEICPCGAISCSFDIVIEEHSETS